jgi:hypothetical protein
VANCQNCLRTLVILPGEVSACPLCHREMVRAAAMDLLREVRMTHDLNPFLRTKVAKAIILLDILE